MPKATTSARAQVYLNTTVHRGRNAPHATCGAGAAGADQANFPVTARVLSAAIQCAGALVIALHNRALQCVGVLADRRAQPRTVGAEGVHGLSGRQPGRLGAVGYVRAAEATEHLPLLVDQGEADGSCRPAAAAAPAAGLRAAGHPLTLRLQPGYDHSYFIASFIGEASPTTPAPCGLRRVPVVPAAGRHHRNAQGPRDCRPAAGTTMAAHAECRLPQWITPLWRAGAIVRSDGLADRGMHAGSALLLCCAVPWAGAGPVARSRRGGLLRLLTGAPLLAAVACLWRARRDRAALGWRAMALALLLWAGGMAFNMIDALGAGRADFTPTPACCCTYCTACHWCSSWRAHAASGRASA